MRVDKDLLQYEGFVGKIVFNSETNRYEGKVLGLESEVTFCGETMDELYQSFASTIDAHILANGRPDGCGAAEAKAPDRAE